MNCEFANATVVVVDDEPDLRAALEALITSVSYRYRGFASAEAFLAHAPPPRPCCLLLDVELPGMSGLDLQGVLEHCPQPIPLVFISGHSDTAVAVNALDHGAIDFLQKPFDPQRLLDRIDDAVRLSAAN